MNLTESTAGLWCTYVEWGMMYGDGSSSDKEISTRLTFTPSHSLDWDTVWCLSTSKPSFCRWQGPMSMSQHGWLTWEWSCMVTLTRRSWLLFSPCLYGCLYWQIPNGKEEQAEFLLPAFNASVVTHQLMDSCGVAIKKSGRYSCYSNCDFSIQLHSVVCSDFMADGMYVSQSFLCLLLTRKLYKTHLVT